MYIGILLAAGGGQRFGVGDKLTQRLEDGTPVALRAAQRLRAVVPQVTAVLRPQAGELAELLDAAGINTVVCPDAALGMGHSLAYAVRQHRDADGWLVALADMPLIGSETIATVLEALQQGAPLVAPSYAGQRGHPVGFSARYLDALLALNDDRGARALLERDADRLLLIPVQDPGVLMDIDTPADLRRLDSLISGA